MPLIVGIAFSGLTTNSIFTTSVLTPISHRMEIAVLDRTPYRMLGLGTYVLSSRLTGLQFVGVLIPQYIVRCTDRGIRKWTS